MKVTVIRSNRRTMAIQVNEDLSVTVRAPRCAPDWEIEKFLRKQEDWIRKSIEEFREQRAADEAAGVKELSYAEIQKLADQAVAYIPKRVAYFAEKMGVSYGRITIRNQKTRWGSCSSKGNLNFNCLLMLMPPEVIDYVIVHELCHRKEMNHSPAFWLEVERVLPDYRKRLQWLKTEGDKIARRMR